MLSPAVFATEQDDLNPEQHWIKRWRELRQEASPFAVRRKRIDVSKTDTAETSFLLQAVKAAGLKHVTRYAVVIRVSEMS
jgi:hypothetical protein